MKLLSVIVPCLVTAVLTAGCASTTVKPVVPPKQPVLPDWPEIAAFTTSYRANETDRAFNVALASAKLDGVVLAPGKAFSFNKLVGERTLEAGYRNAPTLTLEGKEPALGGGICQVSSTVYNALLLADLALVERHAHSRAVRYLPMGRDAAVSWRSKDLKFENRHAFPVRLSVVADHGRLTVRVLAPERITHEIRLIVGEKEEAAPRKELQVLEYPDDLAVGGFWVRLYRQRVVDGSVVSMEPIASSSFYPFKRDVGQAP